MRQPGAFLSHMATPRMMSLCFLVLQNTSLVMVMRHVRARKDREMFLASTAVTMDESLKFLVCLCITLSQLNSGGLPKGGGTVLSSFQRLVLTREGAMMAIPALLYTLQKNLLYVALSNLDAGVYQVAYQGKILTTAMFSYLMLSTAITPRKISALVVLTAGVAMVEVSKMSGDAKPGGSTGGEHPVVGFMAVAAACCTSGFASVFFEYMLKKKTSEQKQAPPSVWVRNLQLSFFAGLIALLTVFVKDGAQVSSGGFFQGYDPLVCFTILLEAGGGLLVGLVIKYADNIAKIFAMALSLTSIAALSALFSDFKVTLTFVVGSALTVLSTYLYSVSPKPAEKASPEASPDKLGAVGTTAARRWNSKNEALTAAQEEV